MSAGIAFRALRPGETDAAARIHRAAMSRFEWYDRQLHTAEEDCAFYREQVFPKATILGAFAEEGLLGHCAYEPGWIEHLYIDPPYQALGIGSALLERVQAENRELQLWAFQANAGARRFYERHGFVAQELTDGSRNEERLPDIRYRWNRS